MYFVNEGGIGRYITGGTFCAIPFGAVVVVGLELCVVITQICGDIKLYVTVIMNFMASFRKAFDGVGKIECDRFVAAECGALVLDYITVNQSYAVVAGNGTGQVRLCVLGRGVCYNLV